MSTENNREAILALKLNLKVEPVQVGDLKICVKTLTGRERDAFENSCFKGKGKSRELSTENIRAKLLVRSICDSSGVRLFADNETELLGDLPADALDTLFTVAQKLSGLGQSDVEEIAGN